MSFDLYAWKAPVPTSALEAGAWLVRADEAGGEAFFRPHPDVGRFRQALLEAFPPDDKASPWATAPSGDERLLGLSFRWDLPDPNVLVRVVELARRFGLVVFDPQGPDVHAPSGVPREPKPTADGASRMPTIVAWSAVGLVCLLAVLAYLAAQAPLR